MPIAAPINELAEGGTGLPVRPGQVIADRYRIETLLGEGGMGVVCKATHVLLGTPVAVKLIRADLSQDAEAVQRFLQEARAAASLKGAHIARVFDVGQVESGEPYLVMEHLDGVGLDGYLRERGPLAVAEAIDILIQACEGLQEAHDAGLVHRDVKPGNLFLARRPDGNYSLKILDFGIAKRLMADATRGLTNPSKSLGSPWYMSPEQMMTPAQVDQRADVWSLGVLLYELLTSRRPFDGESVPQVCAAVLTTEPSLLQLEQAEIAPELVAVLLHCLEKDPGQRIQSVAELAARLEPYASGPSRNPALMLDAAQSSAPPWSRGERASAPSLGSLTPSAVPIPRPARRSGRLTLAVAMLGLLALPIAAWLSSSRPPQMQQLRHRLNAMRWALPWDPTLHETAPAPYLLSKRQTTPLLQRLQLAHAVREQDLPSAPSPDAAPLSPLDAQARNARYEAWLREQGLSRLPTTADE